MAQEHAKRIPDPGFAGDDGRADAALRAALEAHAADPGRLPDVLAALHAARVLTPVVAVLGEEGEGAGGLRLDKSADVAVPLLVADDGARALPVFSGIDSLSLWDPTARPVPVGGPRAAAVARAEQAAAIVVDVAGPAPATLGGPELRALAERRGAVPAYVDEPLRVALHQALAALTEVSAAWLGPWPGSDARLTVALVAGVPAGRAAPTVLAAVRGLLASAGGGVRGVDLAVRPAGEGSPAGSRPVLRR